MAGEAQENNISKIAPAAAMHWPTYTTAAKPSNWRGAQPICDNAETTTD